VEVMIELLSFGGGMILWEYEEKLEEHESFWMDKMIPNEVRFHLYILQLTFVVFLVGCHLNLKLFHFDMIADLQRYTKSVKPPNSSNQNSAKNNKQPSS